jgi:hypothetical protein
MQETTKVDGEVRRLSEWLVRAITAHPPRAAT